MKARNPLFVLIVTACLFAVGTFFVLYTQSLKTSKQTLFSQPQSQVSTSESLIKPVSNPVVYGYLPYWNRNSVQFHPALTHVSYFSLTIQKDGSLLGIPKAKQDQGYRLYENGYLDILRAQMLRNQKLELTLSMMDQEEIPLFVHNRQAHARLIANVSQILSTYPVEGINVDIEYNGSVTDELQDDLVALLTSLKQIIKQKNPKYLLTIAVYGDSGQIQRLTSIKKISTQVDYVIVMAYDYHRRSSPRSGPVSPLYGKAIGKWESDIMEDMKKIAEDIETHKILLGIPFYGYEWSVEDADDPQSFTLPKTGATASYKRVKDILSTGKVKVFWDEIAFSPYLQYEENGKTQRIYYDDPQSLRYKLDLVKNAGFGGIAIWALGYEGDSNDYWNVIDSQL